MAKKVRYLIQFPTFSLRRWSSSGSPALEDVAAGCVSSSSSSSRMISALWNTDADVRGTLDQWANEGTPIRRLEIDYAFRRFRYRKEYDKAMQLSDWIDGNEVKGRNSYRAIRIDLLWKLKGVHEAEGYFNSLQKPEKTKRTYGALLNCYTEESMFDKASSLTERIRELRCASSALNYSTMMRLFMKLGQPEKVPLLVEEMEEKKINPDVYTYNQLINSYATMKDFPAMREVLKKMKSAGIEPGWFTHAHIANIYVKEGLFKDTHSEIRRIQRINGLKDRHAFHTLIKLNAQIKNKAGVYWAWESLRTEHAEPDNCSYLIFLSALSSMGEFTDLHMYFEEWESCCLTYDIRVPNVIIETHLKRDMIEEANGLLERLKKKEAEEQPNAKTFSLFMNYYLKMKKMEQAVFYFEEAFSMLNPGENSWFLDDTSTSAFLNYFEKRKSVSDAEKIYSLVKNANKVDAKLYDSLLRTYIAAGKEERLMHKRMREDKIEIVDEMKEMLGKVCPNYGNQ